MRKLSYHGAVALVLLATGCSDKFWGDKYAVRNEAIGPDTALITNADYRAIHRIRTTEVRAVGFYPEIVEVEPNGTKRTTVDPHELWRYDYVPREVLCSEPSPDVVRTVQAAFSGGFSGSGSVANPVAAGLSGGNSLDIAVAARADAARSEAVGQLTRRIATIQLLRDGLYQACLAYANGALTSETYTTIVSRYDKIMITMLLGEMAVGNFGSAVTVGGGAAAGTAGGGNAEALKAAVTEATGQRTTAAGAVDSDFDALITAQTKLANAKKDLATAADADKASANASVQSAQSEVDAAQGKLINDQRSLSVADQALQAAKVAQALGTGSASATSSGQVSSTGAQAPAVQVAETLYRMQRLYMNDPPFNSIVHVCLDSMTKPEALRPDLRETCRRVVGLATDPQVLRHAYDSAIDMQKLDISTQSRGTVRAPR